MTVQERGQYAALCSKVAAEARRKGIPYVKPPRPDGQVTQYQPQPRQQPRQQQQQQSTGLKHNRDEVIKAITLLQCTVSQLDHINDFLQAIGSRSPAASVYADITLDIMDKITDVETILIGLK